MDTARRRGRPPTDENADSAGLACDQELRHHTDVDTVHASTIRGPMFTNLGAQTHEPRKGDDLMLAATDRRTAVDLIRAVHQHDDTAAAALLHHPHPDQLVRAVVDLLLAELHENHTDIDTWLDLTLHRHALHDGTTEHREPLTGTGT